ncbi:hypothetical protein GCM10010831_08540 [Psychroflexus salis]|uniref:prolyl oligopeptidase n=2 Tax=Psychroflexus salis TaxID=1526574 RepID=A0A916ZRV3_9FLAO|nr:hypothetical protein GCM10010831_08540 [Psychroflexus salis]
MEKDSEKLDVWLHHQDSIYKCLSDNYIQEKLLFKQKISHDKSDSLIFLNKKRVGAYYVYQTKDGIYYQKTDQIDQQKLFLSIDELKFYPKIVETNYSNYLIIKGSRFLNDNVTLQVWDLDKKVLITELQIYDRPQAQATSTHLYFLKNDKKTKKELKKFNFEDRYIKKANLKSKYSFKVIDSTSVLTKLKNEVYIYSEHFKQNKPEVIKLPGNLKYIGKNNTSMYFYNNLVNITSFYSYNIKKKEFHEIYQLNRKVNIEKCIYHKDIIYYSFIERGRNNLYSLNYKKQSCNPILSDELAKIEFEKHRDNSILVTYKSFKIPVKKYEFSPENDLTLKYKNINQDLVDFKTVQKWVKNDNDSIPLIFYYKNSLVNSFSPTIVNVYGGFNKSIQPSYSKYINSFVEKGGVFVIAGVRGGGENGINWHTSATLLNKKNSFYDFEKCLDYIIENKISTSDQIAIFGASNGGLIVNNAILKFSEKFSVAISMFGLADMLNYTKYNQPKWYNEFGNPQNEKVKEYLKSYSPLHNLKKIENENLKILFITGDKDLRVSPFNSYKFVNGLQEFGNQAYLKVFQNVGHNFENGKLDELYTETYSFIFSNLKFEKYNLND